MRSRQLLTAIRVLAGLGREGGETVVRHWALTLFSLIAAFGIWMVVEDIENPRAEALAPVESAQPIPVLALNVPDNAIMREQLTVRVRVEAREADLPELRANDFRATIDLRGVAPGELVNRTVKVESRRDGVRVVSVQPANFDITLARAETREVPVLARLIGEMPSGYKLKDGVEPAVDPAIVRLRGQEELVASVASVEVEVSVTGARDETVVLEGDLVARTAAGNRVDVTVTPSRARVTLKVEQTFSQRTLVLIAGVTGTPAPGFRVTNITVDPPSVAVAGPKSLVDFLPNLSVEKVDVSGARTDTTQTKQIDRVPNVTIDRQTVVVRVEVRPIECGPNQGNPCGSSTYSIGPLFDDVPTGISIEPGSTYSVQVRVSGPLAQLAALKASDVKVTISLRGASVGAAVVTPVAAFLPSAPTGLRFEAMDPATVRLIPLVFGP